MSFFCTFEYELFNLIKWRLFQLVYKVKSNHLLDCLGPWKVDRLTTEEVASYLSQLHQCLENIRVRNFESLLF